jgi:hypothetical protein
VALPNVAALGFPVGDGLAEEYLALGIVCKPYTDEVQVAINLGKNNEIDGMDDTEIAADQSLVTLRQSAVLNVSPLEDARPIGKAGGLEARFWALGFMERPISFVPDNRRKRLRQRAAKARQLASWGHRTLLGRNGDAGQRLFIGS